MDCGLLPYRELDDALGLADIAITKLLDGRHGKNTRHKLSGLFRQAVFGRIAGYEDVNDAERLARDPAMRAIVGREGLDRAAASSSQMGRFETEWLATDANLEALTDLSAPGSTECMHESRPTGRRPAPGSGTTAARRKPAVKAACFRSSRGSGVFILSNRHGDEVAWKAAPDPMRKL
jgi:Transposase DDE domain group 1